MKSSSSLNRYSIFIIKNDLIQELAFCRCENGFYIAFLTKHFLCTMQPIYSAMQIHNYVQIFRGFNLVLIFLTGHRKKSRDEVCDFTCIGN